MCGSFCITGPEVAFDDDLVLLLVPSCDDEVILRADEPEELLKPATRGKGHQYLEHTLNQNKIWICACAGWLTSRLSWPSEWWSPSGPPSGFAVFSSLQISWPGTNSMFLIKVQKASQLLSCVNRSSRFMVTKSVNYVLCMRHKYMNRCYSPLTLPTASMVFCSFFSAVRLKS